MGGVIQIWFCPIVACKRIVDEDLNELNEPGTTTAQLYEHYVHFGLDPFIVPVDPNDEGIKFSGWIYAKERCSFLASDDPCEKASKPSPSRPER